MSAEVIYARVFCDTNVMVYLYSEDEPTKKAQAKKIIEHTPEVFISTQVVMEKPPSWIKNSFYF
jgi:predicted nucleic acid-binding protein